MAAFVEKGAALAARVAEKTPLAFDKDDKAMMAFVEAASTLRASTHSIAGTTSFEMKEMAGNIVPAISSTNAMAAAFQVQEAIKLVREGRPRVVYCDPAALKHVSSIDAISEGPNPKCQICMNKTQRLTLHLRSLSEARFGWLVEEILRGKLALSQPVVVAGDLYYEGTPEEAELNATTHKQPLDRLGLSFGMTLAVDDFSQKVQVELTLQQLPPKEGQQDEQEDYELEGEQRIKAVAEEAGSAPSQEDSKVSKAFKEEDGVMVLEDSSQEGSAAAASQEKESSKGSEAQLFGKKVGEEGDDGGKDPYDFLPPLKDN